MTGGEIRPRLSRGLWFIGLWAASAMATAVFAYALRWVLLG